MVVVGVGEVLWWGKWAEDIYSGAHGDVMPSAGPTSGKISPAGRPTQSGDVDV